MYRLLIAEDDSVEREALADLVDWQALGVQLSGSAESPEDAIDMTYSAGYDILLADIRQPGLSGMELAQTLMQHQPNLKAVVCGGQGEPGPGLRHIARPISLNELKTALAGLVKLLDEERASGTERLRDAVRAKEAHLRRHFFDRLVMGSLSDAELLKGLEHFGIGTMQGRFAMLLIELDGFDRQAMSQGWESLQMMLEAVRQAVEALGVDGLLDCAYIDRGRFGVLLGLTGAGKAGEARHGLEVAERIRSATLAASGGSVTVGIGSTVSRLRDLKQSFRSAAAALATKSDSGRGQVISHADSASQEPGQQAVDLAALEESLALAVQTASVAEARGCLDRLFSAARRKGWDDARLNATCMRLLTGIRQLLLDQGEQDGPVFENGAVWQKMLENPTAPEMAGLMDRCVAAAAGRLLQRRTMADRALVQRGMEWIEARLASRVTAADLALELSCSPSYVSAAFRRHTGKTLAASIRDARLDRALELLQDPANRVGEVAIRVGYPNVAGFYSLFKKKYGMNPAEYRENGSRNRQP